MRCRDVPPCRLDSPSIPISFLVTSVQFCISFQPTCLYLSFLPFEYPNNSVVDPSFTCQTPTLWHFPPLCHRSVARPAFHPAIFEATTDGFQHSHRHDPCADWRWRSPAYYVFGAPTLRMHYFAILLPTFSESTLNWLFSYPKSFPPCECSSRRSGSGFTLTGTEALDQGLEAHRELPGDPFWAGSRSGDFYITRENTSSAD